MKFKFESLKKFSLSSEEMKKLKGGYGGVLCFDSSGNEICFGSDDSTLGRTDLECYDISISCDTYVNS